MRPIDRGLFRFGARRYVLSCRREVHSPAPRAFHDPLRLTKARSSLACRLTIPSWCASKVLAVTESTAPRQSLAVGQRRTPRAALPRRAGVSGVQALAG